MIWLMWSIVNLVSAMLLLRSWWRDRCMNRRALAILERRALIQQTYEDEPKYYPSWWTVATGLQCEP